MLTSIYNAISVPYQISSTSLLVFGWDVLLTFTCNTVGFFDLASPSWVALCLDAVADVLFAVDLFVESRVVRVVVIVLL